MYPFVDAHIHLWQLDRIHYPWLRPPFDDAGPNGSVEPIARDYLLDDYLVDARRWNVAGAVHVDAGADAAQALDETAWLQATAEARGLPSGIVAFAALDDPQLDRLLQAHVAHDRVRGIRHIVNWHADPRRTYTPADLTQGAAWQAGFGQLAAHGLSFDLQCYPGQMAGLAPLIARTPGVPVIVNHLGMPVLDDADGLETWRAGLRALARSPHVAIKLSGFGFIRRGWTYDHIRPLLEEAVAIFGPDRCLFASDAPTDLLFAPFDRTMAALATLAAQYSESEQRAMWGGNANRLYRLGLDLTAATKEP